MVTTRNQRTLLAASSSSSSSSGTSVILWDLPLHTTEVDLSKTFKKIGKPVKVSFISRRNHMTKYTYCCELKMKSADEANKILERPHYRICGANVWVDPYPEGTLVKRGEYKMVISDMNFRIGAKGFEFLRRLFEDCSCADIQILKKPENCDQLEGTAKLRFRTSEGREKARVKVNDFIKISGKKWVVVIR